MNLAKEMKKKRDAEKRLEQNSPTVIFTEKVEGGEGKSYNDYSNFATKKQLNDGLAEKSGTEHLHKFIDLEDSPNSYAGQAGKVTKVKVTEDGLEFGDGGGGGELVQATETVLGGIKAKAKTTEINEVAIDTATGKLYANSSGVGGETTLPNFMSSDEDGIKVYDSDLKANLIATIGRILDAELSAESSHIPTMTGYNIPSGIVTSSTEFDASYPPWRAFDKNTSYYWSAAGPTGWISYEFPTSKIINKYNIKARADASDGSPKNWTFEGWNGSSWIVLDNKVNITGWSNGEVKEFIFINNTPYIKYRLNVSANNGRGTLNINEIEMIEIIAGVFIYGVFTNQNIGDILPTPSKIYRGKIFILLGGTGVADIPYICIKDATDTYVWKEI